MWVVKVMQKKHVMELKVNGQTVTIGTDDLGDLMEQSWIRKSLGLEGLQQQQQQDGLIEARKYRDLAVEFRDEAARLRAELELANRKLEVGSSVVVQETKQPAGGERVVTQEPPRPPQRRPPQAPAPRAGPMMPSQQLPEKSAMDVAPNEMTEAIWMSMSPEEQAEWQGRYNMKG